MKNSTLVIIFLLATLTFDLSANGPKGKDFGFGLILGDPLGATIKVWTNKENAFDAYIGGSYFGSIRIGGDYLWHFDAFNSQIVKMYAGLGATIAFGRGAEIWYKYRKDRFYYRESSEIGVGIRAIMGINIIPKKTPLEIFFEIGPMIGIIPNAGVGFDASIGLRFYP